MDLTIPQGVKGRAINFTLKEDDGDIFVLTGYTPTMKVWRPGKPGNVLWSGECDIDDADAGTCHYTTATDGTDFHIPGEYWLSIVCTKTGVADWVRIYEIEVTERPQ